MRRAEGGGVALRLMALVFALLWGFGLFRFWWGGGGHARQESGEEMYTYAQ